MYSFVIKLAIDFNRAVLLELIIPAPGLIKPIVEELIGEADPNIISVRIIITFFLFSDLYLFL